MDHPTVTIEAVHLARLRNLLGRIPGGPGAPISSRGARAADLDIGELLDWLEQGIVDVTDVCRNLGEDRTRLMALELDLAAFRRVIGAQP